MMDNSDQQIIDIFLLWDTLGIAGAKFYFNLKWDELFVRVGPRNSVFWDIVGINRTPTGIQRNNNVIMASKRHRDVVLTLFLGRVSAGREFDLNILKGLLVTQFDAWKISSVNWWDKPGLRIFFSGAWKL